MRRKKKVSPCTTGAYVREVDRRGDQRLLTADSVVYRDLVSDVTCTWEQRSIYHVAEYRLECVCGAFPLPLIRNTLAASPGY